MLSPMPPLRTGCVRDAIRPELFTRSPPLRKGKTKMGSRLELAFFNNILDVKQAQIITGQWGHNE